MRGRGGAAETGEDDGSRVAGVGAKLEDFEFSVVVEDHEIGERTSGVDADAHAEWLVASVVEFAGFDRDGQAAGGSGQRAGGVGGEGAGRVVGFVEVEDDGVAGGDGGFQEAAGAVGGFAGGAVMEDEEECAFVDGRIEAEGLALEAEFGVAGAGGVNARAEYGGDTEGFRRVVAMVFGFDAVFGADGIPAETVEVAAGFGVGVLEADADAVAAFDDEHLNLAGLDDIGGLFAEIGLEDGGCGGLAIDEDVGAGGGVESDAAIVEGEDAGMGGSVAGGESDIGVGCGSGRVGAFFQPGKAGEGEPAVGLAEFLLAMGAPLFDRRLVGGRAGGEQESEQQRSHDPRYNDRFGIRRYHPDDRDRSMAEKIISDASGVLDEWSHESTFADLFWSYRLLLQRAPEFSD